MQSTKQELNSIYKDEIYPRIVQRTVTILLLLLLLSTYGWYGSFYSLNVFVGSASD